MTIVQGSLLALDINKARLELVRKAAVSQGLDHMIRVEATSLQDYVGRRGSTDITGSPAVQAFDRVLLDAPCSGTGVLAKRADLRWRRTAGQLRELVGLQVRGCARFCRQCPPASHALRGSPAADWGGRTGRGGI